MTHPATDYLAYDEHMSAKPRHGAIESLVTRVREHRAAAEVAAWSRAGLVHPATKAADPDAVMGLDDTEEEYL